MNGKADGQRKTGYKTGLNCIKGASGKVIVDGKGIKDMEKLMNEENEWDHKISAEVKE